MKRYTREKLVRIYTVSAVLGIISFFVMWFAVKGAAGYNVLQLLILMPFSIVALPVGFCAMRLNLKKILIGMIAPIPVLSSIIEYTKGLVYAVRALICIFKHHKAIVIGREEVTE